MQQEGFDHWRRDEDTDTNIGSNGDGSSLEVPRTTDLWESMQCLRPLGYGVNNFDKRKQDSWLIFRIENWLKTDSISKQKMTERPDSTNQTKTETNLQFYNLHFGPQTEIMMIAHTFNET